MGALCNGLNVVDLVNQLEQEKIVGRPLNLINRLKNIDVVVLGELGGSVASVSELL